MKKAPSTNLFKLALTGGALVGSVSAAQAAILTTATNINLAKPANNVDADTLQFNLSTGQIGFGSQNNVTNPQFRISYPGQFSGKAQMQGVPGVLSAVLYVNSTNSAGNANNYVVNNAVGSQISDASGTFANGSDVAPYLAVNFDNTSQFMRGMQGYAGLLFVDANGQVDYGYAQLTYNQDESITFTGFAYDNTGAPITVAVIPPVPEPGTVATSLLALGGAVGAVVARRRRAAKSMAA